MQRRLVQEAGSLERLLDGFVCRFAYVNEGNLEPFAERFARLLRATEIPRDPLHLLDAVGIVLEPTLNLPPRHALWTREGGRYHIYYSRHDRPATVRFSLWHEVFEMLSDRPRFPSALPEPLEHRLADRFAACMLMPADPLRAHARELAGNPTAASAVLAHRFGVSISAMRLRLRELGIPPLSPRERGLG